MKRDRKITVAELLEMAENFKFTKPQQAIIDRLATGDRLTVINQHHMSGGEFRWKSPNGNLDYAGKVYRAFFNIAYVVGVASISDAIID